MLGCSSLTTAMWFWKESVMIENAKVLGALRFGCDEEDIKVTIGNGIVEVLQKSTGAAIYYLIEDFDDAYEDDCE